MGQASGLYERQNLHPASEVSITWGTCEIGVAATGPAGNAAEMPAAVDCI